MPIVDPTEIADLHIWADASVVTITGQGISNMDNQEGTAARDLLQPVDGRRPPVISIKGTSAADFDGIDDALRTEGAQTAVPIGTVTFTCVLPPSPGGSGIIFVVGQDGSAFFEFAIYGLNDQIHGGRAAFTGPAVSASPDGDWAWGDRVIITVTYDSTTEAQVLRIARIQKDTGTGSNFNASNGWSMGALGNSNDASDIQIFGITIYTRILTAQEITDLEDFHNTTYIVGINDPPISDAGPDQTVRAEDDFFAGVSLDGSASSDDVAITNYEWTDGLFITLANGAGEVQPDVNLLEGVHTITLEVSDAGANTDTDIVVITVEPKIRTYKSITNSTATDHIFGDVFPLFDKTVEPFHNQIRILKKDTANVVTELFPVGRESATGTSDLTISIDGQSLVLNTALVATDTLVILRETRMDRSFAVLGDSRQGDTRSHPTGGAYLRARDRNLRGDQILFIAQELREIRDIADILGSATGETFEYTSAGGPDVGLFSVEHVGDGSTLVFSYADIDMLPAEAVTHDDRLVVTIDGDPITHTANETAETVTLPSAPPNGTIVHIERKTRIDRRWVTHKDGNTLSSVIEEWDRLNIKFIAEETPDFPTFLLDNFLSNRIFPRLLNELVYSGPGDRFTFGNIAWYGDGEVFIFIDDIPVESTIFTIDFIHWEIVITVATGETLRIETTTPNHAYHSLSFGGHQSIPEDDEVDDPDEDEIFEVEGTFEILRKRVNTGDDIVAHTAIEIGEATGGIGDEKGAILFLTATNLGSEFAGAEILDADITVLREGNTLTASNSIEPTDADPRADVLYATVDARIITGITIVPTIPVGLGKIKMDATDVFQAAADENFSTAIAFFVAHEDPLPADASNGRIILNGIVKFRVRYKIADVVVTQSTLDTLPVVQNQMLLDQDEPDTNQGQTGRAAAITVTSAAGVSDTQRSVLYRFDISGLSSPVTAARLFFGGSNRFAHTGPGTELTNIQFAWLDDATGLQNRITGNLQLAATWNHMRTALADPGPTTKWVAIVTNGDDADEGGGTDAADFDAASLVSILWPGIAEQTNFISNWQVFGLKALIDAALDAGRTELDLVMFLQRFVTKGTSVTMVFTPVLANSSLLTLIVDP